MSKRIYHLTSYFGEKKILVCPSLELNVQKYILERFIHVMCIYSLALLKRNTPRDYILKRDAQYAEYMHLWGAGGKPVLVNGTLNTAIMKQTEFLSRAGNFC